MTTIQKQDWHHSDSACCMPFSTCTPTPIIKNFHILTNSQVCLSWWCPCIVYGRAHHRVKNNGNMNAYSCCNLSVCLHSPYFRPLLTFPVRRVHRPRLSRHPLHRVNAEPRRHARKVPPQRQRLHGLSVRVVLYAVRLDAAGQGGGVPRAECVDGPAGQGGRDGVCGAAAGSGVSSRVRSWES
jgi:hypothetical protein